MPNSRAGSPTVPARPAGPRARAAWVGEQEGDPRPGDRDRTGGIRGRGGGGSTGCLLPAPAVLFASAAEAALALELAGPRGAVLLSHPGGASWPGARLLSAMLEAARARHPGAPLLALLDAGDAAGLALDALRRGWRDLILDPACPALDQVSGAALAAGGRVLTRAPQALDPARLDLRREAGRAILARHLAGPAPHASVWAPRRDTPGRLG